jgi:predicted TIM-barrel fold metal-dependent hydrolase
VSVSVDTGYDIVDLHVHLQEDTEMEKLMYPKPGWPDSWYWFSPKRVRKYMDFHGFSHLVCVNLMNTRRIEPEYARSRGLSVSTKVQPTEEEKRDLVKQLNRWACSVGAADSRLIQFAATEPMLFKEKLADEIEECLAQGARGLKVHPRNGGHLPDHPFMHPVYELCQDREIPILTDTGGDATQPSRPLTEPAHWIPVLRKFPRLRLIMAHFCGEYWEQRVQLAEEFSRESLVFDTAGGLVDETHLAANHRQLSSGQAVSIFRKVGIDRILFGSDAPFNDPMDSARQVVALDLTELEKEKILGGNARAYLGVR